MTSKRRELLLLPLLLSIGALLVTAVYIVTAQHIAANRQRAADTILLDALALPAANTTLSAKGITEDRELLALREPRQIYLARQNNQIVAIILPLTARDGYNGPIDLIAGIAPDGKIINVRAIDHRETAGLGDRIDVDKSAWINQFIGKSLNAPMGELWSPKNAGGAFDQITGATVTSRAVIDAVHNALQYFEQHREQLLEDSQ